MTPLYGVRVSTFPRPLLAAALVLALTTGLMSSTAASASTLPDRAPGRVPAAAATPALTFATYNVCKADCAAPAPSWGVRRDRLARVVGALGADVLGLQEATNQPVNGRGVSQWDDIQRVVAPLGYAAPRSTARNDTCGRGASCTHTARLLYRTATVTPVRLPSGVPAAGYVAQRDIAPSISAVSGPREVAWAYLRGRDGSGPFLAVAMHLATEKDARTEADRVAVAASLGPWADALGARLGIGTVPVVLMADLNSFDRRQPAGAQAVLRASGWSDAWKAPKRRNVGINSTNYSPTSRSGWPERPLRNASGVASRVDYIMFRGAGVRARTYHVVVWLDANGSFLESFRASDHNPIRTRLVFGQPATT